MNKTYDELCQEVEMLRRQLADAKCEQDKHDAGVAANALETLYAETEGVLIERGALIDRARLIRLIISRRPES